MNGSRVEIEAFDFIDAVNAATQTDQVYSLLAKEFAKFGFTDFLITDMPPPSLKLDTHVIMSGWSSAWFERYMEQDFYAHDPMARRTRETLQPFFWDEVEVQSDDGAQAHRVMNEAADFGLKKGFSVPIFGAEGEQSCVTMGGRQLSIPPRGREALHLMSVFAHNRARALRRNWQHPPATQTRLTAREREVLKWVARGKTDWEIGEILNISKETSYAHVKSSCRKLDAVTRTQAVVRAMQLGEIAL
jgi:LuxR family quorum sensing-dependent transcriptional regulator